jgi:glycine/D-amino acid oxidase-like deaminating enzyme
LNVVIIGCGIVGAAIAYELSQLPALSVTVLEQQPQPANGATGAALGVLMGAICQKPKGRNLQMRLYGIQRYDEWVPELIAQTGRPIWFNRQGLLRLCFEGEDIDRWTALAAMRQTQGWELDLCDRAQLATLYPHLSLERVIGAVYSPCDRQLDPTAMTFALVEAATQRGATFQFNCPVSAISSGADGVQVQTAAATFNPDWVVITAGVGTTPLLGSLNLSTEIRPVLGQAVRLKVAQPFGHPQHQPVITGEDVHLVPLGQDEYWVGATVEFPTATGMSLPPQPDLLEQVMTQAIAMVPALQNATQLHHWYGLRPRPEGRPAPIIERHPEYPNVILATGHYRNGVLLAPATAHQVREWITT